MEFTKEEWYAVEYAGYWELQTSPYYDADGKNLLDAEAVGEKEAKANAALMQAAPKMFEALQESLSMMEQTLSYRENNNLTSGNVFLSTTISKVKSIINKQLESK